MKIAHQPGSEHLTIPEQMPNSAVRPLEQSIPQRKPAPNEPIKTPDDAPANHTLLS